eukprot:181330_1
MAKKHCSKKLKNSQTVIWLMESIISSKITPDLMLFNEFFHCMAWANLPDTAFQYFEIMRNKYKLEPDIIMVSTLIKTCRHQAASKYKLAEMYFNLRYQFQLEPGTEYYSEMISVYAKAHQIEAAKNIFTEYKHKVDNKEFEPHAVTFGAYIDAFSSVGDVNGMVDSIKLFKKYMGGLDIIATANIMEGFNNCRLPRKAMQVFNEWIDQGLKPNRAMLKLKCIAHANIIKDDEDIRDNFAVKLKEYNELLQIVDANCKMERNVIDPQLFTIQLFAAIALYHDVNPMEIVKIFEQMVENNNIGYTSRNKQQFAIDLHLFLPLHAQFILRYLIGFKLKEIFYLSKSHKVIMITGKGKHAEGTSNEQYSLQTFVQQELLRYNPPIKAIPSVTNTGQLEIEKSELLPYLHDETNFAKNKLLQPSTDWYWDDPRKKNDKIGLNNNQKDIEHGAKFGLDLNEETNDNNFNFSDKLDRY